MSRQRPGVPPPHGRYSRHNRWKCRCDPCRQAAFLYRKRRRQGRGVDQYVDGTGTVRRIRALTVLGYTCRNIASRLGNSWQQVQRWSTLPDKPETRVMRVTAEKVQALAWELAGLPAPAGYLACRSRERAAALGWHGFGAWDDIDDPTCRPCLDVQADPSLSRIEQALAGQIKWGDLRRYPAERTEVVRQLTGRGLSATAIAKLLHSNTGRVRDWQDTHGIERIGGRR